MMTGEQPHAGATPTAAAVVRPIDFEALDVRSPKRTPKTDTGWDGFFPYYAGYPQEFAHSLLTSAKLPAGSTVLDPWNGSGTTTYSAAQLGLSAMGFDLNPAMVIIARARLLPASEADSLIPLAREILKDLRADPRRLVEDDPLLWWFEQPAAALIRAIETRIRDRLVGGLTLTATGPCVDRMSGLAATFYVALFSVCRQLVRPYRSSNPTWLKRPKTGQPRLACKREDVLTAFANAIEAMTGSLVERAADESTHPLAKTQLKVADTTRVAIEAASVDFILSSPPYCTRIDYSAATRIELAILFPLLQLQMEDLGRRMIGSTRVPDHAIDVDKNWGETCGAFLAQLKRHPSKASSGYYLKTHLDYFKKMAGSLGRLSKALKPGGAAVLVVQDSYYKEVHNDLPTIIVEMAAAAGMDLKLRRNFRFSRSMSGINPHTRIHQRAAGAMESVLCFEKPALHHV